VLDDASFILEKKGKKIPSQEMMIVCVNNLPLEKVVAMSQLCEYGN
jgi:hypothetical protein